MLQELRKQQQTRVVNPEDLDASDEYELKEYKVKQTKEDIAHAQLAFIYDIPKEADLFSNGILSDYVTCDQGFKGASV